jgi:hypothetical protein
MRTRHVHVVVALILGAVAALLLWQGPERVADAIDALEAIVMRALGKKEAANRLELLPQVRDALDAVRAELAAEGIETFIGSTYRTVEQQAAAVANRASDTEQSWHRLRRAVDLYPIDPETGFWDGEGRTWDTLFRRMHDVAAAHGFRGIAFVGPGGQGARKFLSSGRWDGGHLEYREGLTWAAAAEAQGVIG